MTVREIRTAADVDEQVLDLAQDVWESWFDGGRVDSWDDFITRMEGPTFDQQGVYVETLDFGPDMLSPAIRKIQRHISKLRKED